MKLDIHTKGVALDDELRRNIERRFRTALTRFDGRLGPVRVSLTDVNGPRGGEDILCKIHTSLRRDEEILVAESHHSPVAAVTRAFERTTRVLTRRLQRGRAVRRGRFARPLLPLPEQLETDPGRGAA
ncbi:MAG: HPF/RaiA family ribosome-associated protein [Planctomycetota bacterium]|jgi:ribosome-associated translation inhibitor RaiA